MLSTTLRPADLSLKLSKGIVTPDFAGIGNHYPCEANAKLQSRSLPVNPKNSLGMPNVKRPVFTKGCMQIYLRKKLLTDCMHFGMLIAKRSGAMVVISGRSGRSGRGMVAMFACSHACPP